jgi:hypothetical protein
LKGENISEKKREFFSGNYWDFGDIWDYGGNLKCGKKNENIEIQQIIDILP